MPKSGPYSAFVLIDDQPVPEYNEEGGSGAGICPDGSPKHTVFIESKTGQRFAIKMAVDNATPNHCVLGTPYTDGKSHSGCVFSSSNPYLVKGALNHNGTETRPFLFATVKLVSDDDGERAAQLLEEQKGKPVEGGSIKVEFWSYYKTGTKPANPYGSSGGSDSNRQIELHEKAKKAYGAPIREGTSTFVTGQRTGTTPLHTFVFEYRSRTLLEAMGFDLPPIIEPAGADIAPPAAPAPASASSAKPKIKRENSEVQIKEERPPPKKYKTSKVGGVLTVDLTEDD